MARSTYRLPKELLLALAALGLGLVALPLVVYWVGTQVVGEYVAEGGMWALARHVWSDLAAGNVFAWLLVTSPYLILQLWRLGRMLWRQPTDVTSVTAQQ